mgnify:FL=1
MSDIFDDWFKRMRRFMDEIDRIFDEMFREFTREYRRGGYGKPLIYGFSITYGPDGKPIIREFGNVKPSYRGPIIREETEPYVDIIEEEDTIKVIAELPGVDKKDIDVSTTEDLLVISTRGPRRYYKEVRLPAKVKPETAKAKYKNGVLEITLEKLEKKHPRKGVKINIE